MCYGISAMEDLAHMQNKMWTTKEPIRWGVSGTFLCACNLEILLELFLTFNAQNMFGLCL
jgi:hypothetical protein